MTIIIPPDFSASVRVREGGNMMDAVHAEYADGDGDISFDDLFQLYVES